MHRAARISFVAVAVACSAIASLAIPRVAHADAASDAEAQYVKGVKLYHAGRFEDARKLFVQSIAQSPKGVYAPTAAEMIKLCDEKLNRIDGPRASGDVIDPYGTSHHVDPYVQAPPAAKPTPGEARSPLLDPYATPAPVPPAPAPAQPAPTPILLDPYATPAPPKASPDLMNPYGEPRAPDPELLNPYGPSAPAAPQVLDPYAAPANPEPPLRVETPYPEEVPAAPEPPSSAEASRARVELTVFSGLYGMTAGGLLFGAANPSSSTNPGGAIVLGGAAGLGLGFLLTHGREITEGQSSLIMGGTVWFAMDAGLFAKLADDPNGVGVSKPGYYGTILIGSAFGLGISTYYAVKARPTLGAATAVNSFGLMGVAGGLLAGVAMKPPDDRAYALNTLIGSTAGIVIGLYASSKVDISKKRILVIDGVAAGSALAGYLTFSAFASSSSSDTRQRIATGAAVAFMGAGAIVTWVLTKNMHDESFRPHKATDAAPPALIGRDADGEWHIGAPAIYRQPPEQGGGMGVSILAGQF